MHLTQKEEETLDGEFGLPAQEAMEFLVSLGEHNNARRLRRIKTSHVAGISFGTIGKVGLDWLEHLNSIGTRKKMGLRATTNPAGMDLENYEIMGVKSSSDFYKNQVRIIECLEGMNLEPTWSCSALLHLGLPYKSHVAFAESHLACFANSQGVRTTRESGPAALYSAIAGKTPDYGYHLDENRGPTVVVEVQANYKLGSFKADTAASSALGYWIGRELRKDAEERIVVPYIRGDVSWLADACEQESLAAGLASNSRINHFHIEGMTREAVQENFDISNTAEEKLTYTKRDEADMFNLLSDPVDKVDTIFMGCPHLYPEQLEDVCANFDYEAELKGAKRCWLFTGRDIYGYFTGEEKWSNVFLAGLSETGGEAIRPLVFFDTCLVVAPLKEIGVESVATNSAKAAHYIKTVHNLKSVFTDTDAVIEIARYGRLPKIQKLDMPLYKGSLGKPKGRPYLCPQEGKVIDLDIYGSSTQSTAFGAVGICPDCKGFAFKL